MKPLQKARAAALLICSMVSSCDQLGESPVASPSAASVTDVATSPALPTPEESATPLHSSTVEHTSTPIVYPTITLMPTLPAAEAEAKVLELLRDNGDCRLPCFWGFTPGQTSVQTFKSVRHTLGGSTITIPRDDMWLEITVLGGSRNDQSDVVDGMKVSMTVYRKLENESREVFDSPLYAQYFQYYTLPYLLSTYGPPTNAYIFLDVGIADMGLGIDLYLLLLEYVESGWGAILTMPLLWQDEARTVALGCPAQASTQLRLWAPGDTKMANEYGFGNGAGNSYTIEEATSLTLEEFYQQFKDPTNTRCLETPVNINQRPK